MSVILIAFFSNCEEWSGFWGMLRGQVGGWVGGLRGLGFWWPALAASPKPRPPFAITKKCNYCYTLCKILKKYRCSNDITPLVTETVTRHSSPETVLGPLGHS